MSGRMVRVNRVLREVLAELVPGSLNDPRIRELPSLTVVDVKTAPDLQQAKVYVTCAAGEEREQEAVAALTRAKGRLRTAVGQKVKLRNIPELYFFADENAAAARRIEAILDELADAEPEEGSEAAPATKAADDDGFSE